MKQYKYQWNGYRTIDIELNLSFQEKDCYNKGTYFLNQK